MLYAPWATIGSTDTVFLSLNPGRPPAGAELETLSDERGNSYEVERYTTASPITAQFLALANLLQLRPIEILTGVVSPFRSDRWGQVPVEKRKVALRLGKQFWDQVFKVRRPSRVIACGPEAAEVASDALGARFELSAPSGWGEVSLRRFRAHDGAAVIQLPHLSTFKLLSRAECRAPLGAILEIDDGS
jgi:hypothetical protein